MRHTRSECSHRSSHLESRHIPVLPKGLRDVFIKELDRRLDLDFDELLTSPKLEVKLSPAELDKQLLDLFESMSKGQSGDLLRVIAGGGNDVALQHRYMKRQARKQLSAANALNFTAPFFADSSFENTDENSRTASQWVRWAMRRNLPTNGTTPLYLRPTQKSAEEPRRVQATPDQKEEKDNNLRMSLLRPGSSLSMYDYSSLRSSSWCGMAVSPSSRLITNAGRLSAQRCGKGLSLLI
jgi:hypothetical protein